MRLNKNWIKLHLDFTAQFLTDICYISALQNAVADALSRIETIQIQAIDYNKLSLKSSASTKFVLITLPNSENQVYCEMSYVADEFREIVFKNIHTLSYPGIRATLTTKFF